MKFARLNHLHILSLSIFLLNASLIHCMGMETSLHDAIWYDNAEKVKILIESRANVNSPTEGGNTPLHYAAFKGNIHIIKALIAASAIVNAKNYSECMPLHLAISFGHIAAMQELIAHEADVNARSRDGSTPLHCAVKNLNSDFKMKAVKLLLEHKVEIDPRDSKTDTNPNGGTTPLHYAVANDSIEVAKLLIANGADTTSDFGRKDSPLRFAWKMWENYDSVGWTTKEMKF